MTDVALPFRQRSKGALMGAMVPGCIVVLVPADLTRRQFQQRGDDASKPVAEHPGTHQVGAGVRVNSAFLNARDRGGGAANRV